MARIRAQAEDFRVDEVLGFDPDGEGEHWLIRVRKRDQNTEFVARALGRAFGVRARDIGYCGLKDRHAVTTQWFSLLKPGRPVVAGGLEGDENIEIIEVHRHRRKLRRGIHRANQFGLRLRDTDVDIEALYNRVDLIREHGMPNYFGDQRFGRGGANLERARQVFSAPSRNKIPGMVLSAARSELFNRVLAARIDQGNWSQVVSGEVLMLDGSRSVFTCEEPDNLTRQRVLALDVHPTGPMWGRGDTSVGFDAAAIEARALQDDDGVLLREGLEQAGLKQERRALRVRVDGLKATPEADSVFNLSFRLPRGAYATALLHELVQLHPD